ncbi:HNH endonuclease [Mycobacterium sp. 21AC1]|uniref:HNH endonuclease signature motif containing protein n=1 Tax=[Mycobacterium] appelbergii TaxID=2939269 RepID=UPI002939137E|nr:HNH endonuclease signature motif containing protein [Mycobacterium sp. 21AC1]MDV3124427.1 HNH endonuclease [Mycobacterium sp. 21AC1]
MFEDFSDAALIDDMGIATRAESTAIARRLALIGELDTRREQELAETIFWTTDPFEAVAAEISAAQNVSRGRASGQIRNARALRDRLPKVAAVFATGAIDFRVVLMIISRTENVEAAVMPAVDEALARRAVKWMRLSGPKLLDRIDHWVAKLDPEAVRVPPEVDESRSIHIEPTSPGMAAVWGTLHACDAAAFEQRLDAMAATVCDADPRTHQQRRTDACGALGRLQDRLDCLCGSPDCPAAEKRSAAADAVIHVLADQATIDGTSDEPGYLPGFGIQPAETVRDLARNAKLKPLAVPDDESETGYRPSTALAEFVRWRDLTCRFPGCDARAEVADIDHTAPYPSGPTHPSNNKLYCRTHHLIKTFHNGPSGWTDRQLPDGTVVFTSPTGHTYTTEPHGAALFPALAQPTGELSVPQPEEPSAHRAVMMPTRKQTREQDRRDRIAAERRERAEIIAEQQRQHRAWLAANYEPPPF